MKDSAGVVLVFLRFGVDVSENVDVREVDSEPAEQRGHPDGHTDSGALNLRSTCTTWWGVNGD